MSTLTILAMLYFGVAASPVPEFRLEAETVHEHIDPHGGFFSETADWKESELPTSYLQHYLVLTGSSARFALGKEVVRTEDINQDPSKGMDPKTFRLAWVKDAEILVGTWTTHPVWGGRWVVEAMLVLERAPDGWREVFRDYHDHYYRVGIYGNTSTSLTLESVPSGKGLVLTMRQSNELIAQSEAPLFHKLDSEVMPYVFTETRVYTWPSRIEGGKLITDAGQQYLDLGEEVHPLQAIAEHLVAQETRDAPRQPAELARKLDDLRKLNPTLKNMEKCSGRIEIGKAPAFVAHPEHRWTMQ